MLALQNGHHPEIVCFTFDNWSKQINDRLIDQLSNIKIISIPAGRNPFLKWFYSVFTEKIFRIPLLFPFLSKAALSQAVSRRSNLLLKELKKMSKPDLVVGHNAGAIWPALKAAAVFNCRAGFDVEDYHPGEGHDKLTQNLVRHLMVRCLPTMAYVSFASPLIMKEVSNDLNWRGSTWFTLLNYFPSSDFISPADVKDNRVKLVWFSQNISAGRGLESILPFLRNLPNKLELHLYGNLDRSFYKEYLEDVPNILVNPPVEQKELHRGLSYFDIGLALEPAKDLNNELAISNKMLAYLQSGLYVVASNTIAQQLILEQFPNHGICLDFKTNKVGEILDRLVKDIHIIRSNKKIRFKDFENINWETASFDLLGAWNN